MTSFEYCDGTEPTKNNILGNGNSGIQYSVNALVLHAMKTCFEHTKLMSISGRGTGGVGKRREKTERRRSRMQRTSLDDLERFLRELLSSKWTGYWRYQPHLPLLVLLIELAVTHHGWPQLRGSSQNRAELWSCALCRWPQ